MVEFSQALLLIVKKYKMNNNSLSIKCSDNYGSKVYEDTLELSSEYNGSLFDFVESGNTILIRSYNDSIYKHKLVLKKIEDIGEFIDLAIIITPAKTVSQIIKECGEANVKNALILSTGFRKRPR